MLAINFITEAASKATLSEKNRCSAAKWKNLSEQERERYIT